MDAHVCTMVMYVSQVPMSVCLIVEKKMGKHVGQACNMCLRVLDECLYLLFHAIPCRTLYLWRKCYCYLVRLWGCVLRRNC